MKTTIDIPDQELEDAMKHTQAKTKREAINRAVAEFNRLERVKEINRMMGTLDGFISLKDLNKLRETD